MVLVDGHDSYILALLNPDIAPVHNVNSLADVTRRYSSMMNAIMNRHDTTIPLTSNHLLSFQCYRQ